MPNVPQPTRRPTRKVSASVLAGAAVNLLVWVGGLAGLEVTAEAAASATLLLSAAAGYLVYEHVDLP